MNNAHIQKTLPVQVVGTANAYAAKLAQDAGAEAIYLSGSGVATVSYGIPDLGITTLQDVTEDVRRVTGACDLPLLVDIDTGFGGQFGIARCIRELEKAGAAAVHIEDQAVQKRCGHRPNKMLVDTKEMVDRISAAVDARTDPDFVIMARTDAFAGEGMESAIERSKAYQAAGADMLFAEALTTLEQYTAFNAALPDLPLLANMTEFGQTELFSTAELGRARAAIALYPLSAQRAAAQAALEVYRSILKNGHQRDVTDLMQTRKDLYRVLRYHEYEDAIDKAAQVDDSPPKADLF